METRNIRNHASSTSTNASSETCRFANVAGCVMETGTVTTYAFSTSAMASLETRRSVKCLKMLVVFLAGRRGKALFRLTLAELGTGERALLEGCAVRGRLASAFLWGRLVGVNLEIKWNTMKNNYHNFFQFSGVIVGTLLVYFKTFSIMNI